MSCENTLNFDQQNTFSKNYKAMRVSFWLANKFTQSLSRLRPEIKPGIFTETLEVVSESPRK